MSDRLRGGLDLPKFRATDSNQPQGARQQVGANLLAMECPANRLQASAHRMHQTKLADSGRRGAQRSEVKEEAAGRGTRTALGAMPS